jgi:hypothetical protein
MSINIDENIDENIDKIKLITNDRKYITNIFLYNLPKHEIIQNIKSLFELYSIQFNNTYMNIYLKMIGNLYAINIWNYLQLSDDYVTKIDSNKIISCFKYFITLDLNVHNNSDKIISCIKAYNKHNSFDIEDIEKAHYLNHDEKIKILELMIKYELKINKIDLKNIIKLCLKYNQLFNIFLNSKKNFIIYKNILNKNVISYTINIFINNKKIQYNIIN